MAIEWFPGHMVAAREAAIETIGKTDVVIEVLDARVPYASRNPSFDGLRRKANKLALKVLNKSDLAEPSRTREWLAYYNSQPDTRAIALSAKVSTDATRIIKECLALAPGRGTIALPLRMMILGIPNVGKSTLMNTLLKRHVAKVGDEPAITKMPMKHQIKPGMVLIDTAGMMWPRVAQVVAEKLAATNSIGAGAYDDESIAIVLGDILARRYPQLLAKRFGELPESCDGHALIAHVAKKRSFVVKGGAPDLKKAATVLLTEFRSGVLGAMTLETVDELTAKDAEA